jgi:hypothetical protein
MNRINCINAFPDQPTQELIMKSASVREASAASPAIPVAKPAVKPSAKPPVKTVAKPAAKAPAQVAPKATARGATQAAKKAAAQKPASTPAAAAAPPDKPVKPAKVRLVRDSFTMPEVDFALVAVLKARALGMGRAAKKSELLRAGLQLLNQQEPKVLLAALDRLQPIKTGRPKRSD